MEQQDHQPASIKIYYTRDYSRFSFIRGNRNLNEAKIKKIIKDIKEGLDMLRYCPILVNDNMEIIDGQHRFYVAQKLNSNVWYIICQDASILEIAKINSRTEKWKNEDFLQCYIDQGNEHYRQLDEFRQKHKLSLTDAITLLATGSVSTGGNQLPKFKEGDFQVKYLAEAAYLLNLAADFKAFDQYNKRHFLKAIEKLVEAGKYQHSRLVEKFKKNKEELIKRSSYKEYLQDLELLYNKHAQKRETIW